MKKLAILLTLAHMLPILGTPEPSEMPTQETEEEANFNMGAEVLMPVGEALKALGLTVDTVTPEALNAAYKKLSFECHPDKHDYSEKAHWEEMFKRIGAAKVALEKEGALEKYREQLHEQLIGTRGNLILLALAGGAALGLMASLWYEKFSPYTPYLQISAQGIATREKRIAWRKIISIQKAKGNSTYVINYAKPDGFRDSLIIEVGSLPVTEDMLFELFNAYAKKNNSSEPLTFVTTAFTPEQVAQIKEQGFCRDEKRAIICHAKTSALPLAIGSTASAGVCAWALYSLYNTFAKKTVLGAKPTGPIVPAAPQQLSLT